MDADFEVFLANCLTEYDAKGLAAVDLFASQHPEWEDELRKRLSQLEVLGLLVSPSSESRIDSNEDSPAWSIPGFEILREIGHGASGIVYLAREIKLDRQVALKVLRPNFVGGEEAHRRFQHEARTVARLSHEGIAKLFTSGEANGLTWLAFEYVHGLSLDKVIRFLSSQEQSKPLWSQEIIEGMFEKSQEAPFPVAMTGDWYRCCANIVRQVSKVLSYAHEQGVLHRDIKPSNLILCPSGKVVVVDFGLARTDEQSSLTLTGFHPGTRRTMPPEQWLEAGDSLDARADIYSLGATFFELVSLRPAFGQEGEGALFRAILAGNCPDIRVLADGLDIRLARIISVAMAPDRELRYPSMMIYAEDLDLALSGLPTLFKQPGPLIQFSSWCHRFPLHAGTGLLLFCLLAVVPSMFWWQSRHTQKRIEEHLLEVTEERDRADQAVSALNDVFENFAISFPAWNPAEGGDPDALAQALKEIAVLLDSNEAIQPLVRAKMLESLGLIETNLHLLEDAKRHHSEALDLRIGELGEDHFQSCETRNSLANVERLLGNIEQAEILYRRSVVGLKKGIPSYDADELIMVQSNLAGLLAAFGKPEESLTILEDCLSMIEEDSSSAGLERRAQVGQHLGEAHMRLLNFDGSAAAFQTSLDLARELGSEWKVMYAGVALSYCRLLRLRKDYSYGRKLGHESLNIFSEAYGDDHPWRHIAALDLARLLMDSGSLGESRELFLSCRSEQATDYVRSFSVDSLARLALNMGDLQVAGDLLKDELTSTCPEMVLGISLQSLSRAVVSAEYQAAAGIKLSSDFVEGLDYLVSWDKGRAEFRLRAAIALAEDCRTKATPNQAHAYYQKALALVSEFRWLERFSSQVNDGVRETS